MLVCATDHRNVVSQQLPRVSNIVRLPALLSVICETSGSW